MEFLWPLLQSHSNPIYVKDESGKFILANAALAALYNVTVSELLSTGKLNLDYSAERDLEVIRTGKEITLEEFFNPKSKSIRWYKTTKNTYVQEDGSKYLLSISLDITDLKETYDSINKGTRHNGSLNPQKDVAIKTPLKALLEVASLFKDTSLSKNQEEYIQTIISIAQNLLSTSGDINNIDTINSEILSGLRILVAEDNPANQVLVKAYLNSWKLDVELAHDGAEALAKCKAESFDLILMDIQMPHLSGDEVTKLIRKEPNLNQKTPIIAFTANISNTDVNTFNEFGFTGYLLKPYRDVDLFNIIASNTVQKIPSENNYTPDPSSEPKGPALYDLSGLGNLSKDALFIQKMQRMFVDTIPGQLSKLSQAIEQQDWENARLLSHTLKSTYGNIRIREATEALKKLEEITRQRINLHEIASLMQIIQETTDAVIAAFREDLALLS